MLACEGTASLSLQRLWSCYDPNRFLWRRLLASNMWCRHGRGSRSGQVALSSFLIRAVSWSYGWLERGMLERTVLAGTRRRLQIWLRKRWGAAGATSRWYQADRFDGKLACCCCSCCCGTFMGWIIVLACLDLCHFISMLKFCWVF